MANPRMFFGPAADAPPATIEQASAYLDAAAKRHGLRQGFGVYTDYFSTDASSLDERPNRESLEKELKEVLGVELVRYGKYGGACRKLDKRTFLQALGRYLAKEEKPAAQPAAAPAAPAPL